MRRKTVAMNRSLLYRPSCSLSCDPFKHNSCFFFPVTWRYFLGLREKGKNKRQRRQECIMYRLVYHMCGSFFWFLEFVYISFLCSCNCWRSAARLRKHDFKRAQHLKTGWTLSAPHGPPEMCPWTFHHIGHNRGRVSSRVSDVCHMTREQGAKLPPLSGHQVVLSASGQSASSLGVACPGACLLPGLCLTPPGM